MKTKTLLLRNLPVAMIIMISYAALQANHMASTTMNIMTLDTTPPAATIVPDTVPAKTTSTTEEVKPEKEKKEGFNSKTRFGIRAGGVISKQDYESSQLTESQGKIGADLGIVVTIPLIGGFFAVQPELHWVQKGYKAEFKSTGQAVTTNLDYFEIPVLARFNFGGSIRLFAFGGPCFGWVLDGSYDPDNGLDPTDSLKETETSGHVGVGVGIGTFEFDIRYMAGLSDVSDAEEFKDAKNSSFGAGITLKF